MVSTENTAQISIENDWIENLNKLGKEFTRVSRITCFLNQDLEDTLLSFLKKFDIDAFKENGRMVRVLSKKSTFSFLSANEKLQSSAVNVYRFVIPREHSFKMVRAISLVCNLDRAGRGTVFAQDILEFSNKKSQINVQLLDAIIAENEDNELNVLSNLSYLVFVLSNNGSAERLAKLAIDLGICVPMLTYGESNDVRDKMGLIRITVSPLKELVHLVLPEQDSQNIISILMDEFKMKNGAGAIYNSSATAGVVDTRMRLGKQSSAATVDQIIAAIDGLKNDTKWRKRADVDITPSGFTPILAEDQCEIALISQDDDSDIFTEACKKQDMLGVIASKVNSLANQEDIKVNNALAKSEISIDTQYAIMLISDLFEVAKSKGKKDFSIQILP
jgi:hypothetical protein